MAHQLPAFRPAPLPGSHKGRLAGVRFKSACEQGQTAKETGCTPASGGGGQNPVKERPTYTAHEGHRAAQVAELDESHGIEELKSKLSHAKERHARLYDEVKRRGVDEFDPASANANSELLKKKGAASQEVSDLEMALDKKRRRALRLPVPDGFSEGDRRVLEKAKADAERARATGSFQQAGGGGRTPSRGRLHGERAEKESAAEKAREAQVYIDGLLDRVLKLHEGKFAPKPEPPAVKSISILTKSFDDPPHEKPKLQDPTLHTFRTGIAGKYRVRVVNGTSIRNSSLEHQEFGLYALHADFPDLVPEGEIWVDGRLPISEMKIFIAGAAAELKALERGMNDDDAYEVSKSIMKDERAKTIGQFRNAGDDVNKIIEDLSGYAVMEEG
jgi:hypothetical protein